MGSEKSIFDIEICDYCFSLQSQCIPSSYYEQYIEVIEKWILCKESERTHIQLAKMKLNLGLDINAVREHNVFETCMKLSMKIHLGFFFQCHHTHRIKHTIQTNENLYSMIEKENNPVTVLI